MPGAERIAQSGERLLAKKRQAGDGKVAQLKRG